MIAGLKQASPFAVHVFLIGMVIIYTVAGALIMQWIENAAIEGKGNGTRANLTRSKRAASLGSTNPTVRGGVDKLKTLSGAQLAALDPEIYECVKISVAEIFERASREGCSEDNIRMAAITAIDDCYRNAKLPNLDLTDAAITDDTDLSNYKVDSAGTSKTLTVSAESNESEWNWYNALVFSFTVITTIGYGNIAPKTMTGRAFVCIYGFFGVPLTLLTIGDLGMFISKGLHHILRATRMIVAWAVLRLKYRGSPSGKKRRSKKEKELEIIEEQPETEEEKEPRDEAATPRRVDETLGLGVLFFMYMAVGAHVLSSYEDISLFEAFYFNFVTLTTIGLGDIVPKKHEYIIGTLIYIGVGLALTTMAIEIMSDGLRKLHYFGRSINPASVMVWFGGKKMRMDRLIKNLGDQLNIPQDEMAVFDLTTFVDDAMKVEKGEIATLRKPVSLRHHRSVSYSHMRKSGESATLHFADSTRSSKIGTVGLPPLAAETARTIETERETQLLNPITTPLRSVDSLDRRTLTRVHFSQGSFVGSETTSSMNYSNEDIPTLRI